MERLLFMTIPKLACLCTLICTAQVSHSDGPPTNSSPEGEFSSFKEYSLDDMGHEHVGYSFQVSNTPPLKDRLNSVADTLSIRTFASFPLEVLRIDTLGESLIAIINLQQPDTLHNWTQSFFQGSHGGGSTTISLRKTFLQSEYQGPWIDGVQFYYDSKPMVADGVGYDHINLDGVFYRDGSERNQNTPK